MSKQYFHPINEGYECFHPVNECYGISLRDYYAGQALIGMLSNHDTAKGPCKSIADECYELADAMIEQRNAIKSV